MSQYGEIEDIHLVRNEETGKSRGYCFIKYDDSRSCILAVDNLCGAVVLGRKLRVDHVEKYRLPKKLRKEEQNRKKDLSPSKLEKEFIKNSSAGHAYKEMTFQNKYNIHEGMDLFAASPSPSLPSRENEQIKSRDKINRKEERNRKRQEKKQRRKRREQKRDRNEEKRRQKRARKHHE